MRPFSFAVALASTTVVLALAGCGSDDRGTQPKRTTGYSALTPTQRQQLQAGILSEIDASVTSLTSGTLASGSIPGTSLVGATLADVAHRRALGALRMAGSRAQPRHLFYAGCTKTHPANPLDTDGDAIPDTVTITYNCHLDSLGRLDVSGTIDLGDPTPTTPDVATAIGVNVTIGVATLGETATIPVTAAATIAETPGHITEDATAMINAMLAGDLTGTGTAQLAVTETASYDYTGNFLATFTHRIPPGTFNLNSHWQVVLNTTALTANLAFTITTPGGLTVDTNTCFSNAASIVSGTAKIDFGDNTVVTIVWTNCPSAPTIS